MTDRIAYKVLTAEQWAALRAGTFHGAPVDARRTVRSAYRSNLGCSLPALTLPRRGFVARFRIHVS